LEGTIQRLGQWIDFKMIHSWKVSGGFFAQLFQKQLIYQGYQVMPYSTACTPPFLTFKAGLNYIEVKDPAIIVVNFPILHCVSIRN
jgi:isoleucyl-tRNA synthetase